MKASALCLGIALAALGSAWISGCQKEDAPPAAVDMSSPPSGPDLLNFKSDCGHPGDKGNSLGVGKFCLKIADCSDNSDATLCTTIGDDKNFFCTMACSRTGPANQCGEDASCQCSGGGCGCMPNSCLDTPADGGADLHSPKDQGP